MESEKAYGAGYEYGAAAPLSPMPPLPAGTGNGYLNGMGGFEGNGDLEEHGKGVEKRGLRGLSLFPTWGKAAEGRSMPSNF